MIRKYSAWSENYQYYCSLQNSKVNCLATENKRNNQNIECLTSWTPSLVSQRQFYWLFVLIIIVKSQLINATFSQCSYRRSFFKISAQLNFQTVLCNDIKLLYKINNLWNFMKKDCSKKNSTRSRIFNENVKYFDAQSFVVQNPKLLTFIYKFNIYNKFTNRYKSVSSWGCCAYIQHHVQTTPIACSKYFYHPR